MLSLNKSRFCVCFSFSLKPWFESKLNLINLDLEVQVQVQVQQKMAEPQLNWTLTSVIHSVPDFMSDSQKVIGMEKTHLHDTPHM